MKPFVTAERLRELLDCDPAAGTFRWKARRKGVQIGALAGAISSATGYRIIKIDQRLYFAHRLIWFFVHGVWPGADLDHINRQRADNRIANLRPATRSQNQGNTISRRTNTSGYRGVRRTRYGRWKATISKNCCLIHLGTFDTPEEAHAAYCAEAKSFWGEFAREG